MELYDKAKAKEKKEKPDPLDTENFRIKRSVKLLIQEAIKKEGISKSLFWRTVGEREARRILRKKK